MRAVTISLPALTQMGSRCLCYMPALTALSVPSLAQMGDGCMYDMPALSVPSHIL